MQNHLDIERLARLVKTKRASKGLREVAAEIGSVSPSTLSRVENGRIPDMETFLLLCDWLRVAPSEFFSTDEPVTEKTSAESIEIQLRADKNLDPVTANALATIVRAAYTELSLQQTRPTDKE
jgi:transcriptional regulator with XRE-family HTH domain